MAIGTLMIRADATPAMGAGHIMRCIALAKAWKRNKGDVLFVSAASVPFALQRIRREGFELEQPPVEAGSQEDATLARTIGEARRAQWIAIDGYHFGEVFLDTVGAKGSKILLIDDVGRRSANADVILNQNLHASATMYPERHSKTSLLLGTRFAMLRQEFVGGYPEQARQIPGLATKIFVTLGGGTQTTALTEILRAVGSLGSEIEVAVVGCDPSKVPQFERSARISFLGSLEDMSPVMAWADIAISAAGSTCWELCRFGVPSILIDLADNQRLLGRELHSIGIAMHIPGEKADADAIIHALRELIPDEKRRREMSEKGMALVDGNGSQRVVAALRARGMTLRDAHADDARLLWNWANDPAVRAASFSSQAISWDEHCQWMARTLRDEESRIWVVEENGCPLGTIRARKTSEDRAELAITVAPELRGQGSAPWLIRKGVERTVEMWGLSELEALIKPKNTSSIKAFESAGFQFNGVTTVCGCEALRYVHSYSRSGDDNYAACVGAEQ
jgi:UDP-2,4-diacetamido-2,4,6-trideoxy-beta-L-altropyranose hydrolase